MSELRKAAQMALEVMEGDYRHALRDEAIDAIHAALAQPEQLVVGGDDLPTLTKWTPQRKPLRYVTYVCPVCAASLERQE